MIFSELAFVLVLLFVIGLIGLFIFSLVSRLFSTFKGALYVPISKKIAYESLLYVGLSSNDIFYDLGCGDGRVLVSAAKYFGCKKVVGYEASRWPYLKAKIMCSRFINKGQIILERKDFFTAPFKDATVIFVYLSVYAIDKIVEKFSTEIHSGTKIVSLAFPINLEKHTAIGFLGQKKIGKMAMYLYQKI